MSVAIGDLTQIPVTTRPTQGLPKLGDVQVTLYNQDITNLVWVSYQQWFAPGSGVSIPIQPLTSITISAKRAIYVAATVAGVANLLVLPEGSQANPSPAQIAAQINALGLMKDTTGQSINTNVTGVAKDTSILPLAKDTSVTPLAKDTTLAAQTSGGNTIAANIAATGVPALNLKSTTQTATGLAIAAGATTALTAVTGINQPAYNLHLTATAGAASTKPWYTVTVKWVDTASGFTVQVDAYTAFMSGTSNVMSTVIAGPTDADQCQVSVTNNDTVGMTLNVAFFVLSSRTNYTTDICYQFWTTAAMPTIPTFQIGAALQVPSSKIIFSVNRTVGIGVTTTPDYAMPVYSGQAFLHFDGASSNQWDVIITDQVSGTIVFRFNPTALPTYQNAILILPRSPCTIRFTNNGTVLGTINCEITAV